MSSQGLRVFLPARAPHLGEQCPMRHQRPRLRARVCSSRNSIGVRWTSSPSRRTVWAAEVYLEPVGADHRLLFALASAAQDGVQPSDELARPEWLGDVVIGPSLQGAHLLLFFPDRRENQDRHLTPGADLAADLDPSPSGSRRSMIAASGGFTEAASSAPAASAVSTTSKPASLSTTRKARRICISSSQTRIRWLIVRRERPGPADRTSPRCQAGTRRRR